MVDRLHPAYDFVAATRATLHADFGQALRVFLREPSNETYLALAAARQRDETAHSLRIVVAFYMRDRKALEADFPEQLSHG